jgi:Ca2+-binding EF-hand superfamily protein
VEEFFRDYDKLKLGKIGRGDFERALRLIGVTLTKPEYQMLVDHYKDPDGPSRCLWTKFDSDINCGNQMCQN